MPDALYDQLQEGMGALLPYFSSNNTLQEDADIMCRFIGSRLPLAGLALVRFPFVSTDAPEIATAGDPLLPTSLLLQHAHGLVKQVDAEGLLTNALLQEALGLAPCVFAYGGAVEENGTVHGLLIAVRQDGCFTQKELLLLLFVRKLLTASFSLHCAHNTDALKQFVFTQVLNSLHSSIYITDIHTDEILFMNQTMQEDFGIDSPEGKICWQVLQENMTQRCPFCPVDELLASNKPNPVLQWEETNTHTGRVYQNHDSIIRWVDGADVHLQHSLDITELKSANTDELTQMMTRRAGKNALFNAFARAQAEGIAITVCLYDINLLKDVNDLHGHTEGDRMLRTISQTVLEALNPKELAFRLSGDEFVVLFQTGTKNAQRRVQNILKQLQSTSRKYEMGFCYGLVEIAPDQQLTLEEALFWADERMYEQKRRFHILCNDRLRRAAHSNDAHLFDYDTTLLYDALVDSTDDFLYVCNLKTGVFRYCPAMVKEFGLPGQVIQNAAAVWGAKVHPSDKAAFLESNQEIADGRTDTHCVEYRVQNTQGEWVWVRCRGHVQLDEDNQPTLFAGFISKMATRNKIDALTGLPNKLEFEDAIHYLLENQETRFSVMSLGMDNLRHINDLYDRAFGDEVLRLAAQRMRMLLPSTATLYRLDGDEFGIVAIGSEPARMDRLYRSIFNAFSGQQEYEGRKFYCTFSAGYLMCPADARNYQDIAKYTSYCIEHAKKTGKKRCVPFSLSLLAERSRTLAMIEALRDAVEGGCAGFSLRFQPLVNAATGALVGAEALARWHCKEFGQVSPVEFIPLLEQTGLIVPMGKWVLRTALQQSHAWVRAMPHFVIDINLSYRQLEEGDFVSFLKDSLRDENYPASNVVVELTESYFAQENLHVQALFGRIRALGAHIAMDDFGTGYSALGILKQSPADVVKIDRAFVRGIQEGSFDATFIRFIVEICHTLDIRVCLEGVETEEEYQAVSSMHLDFIQGYLFGKPMTAVEFMDTYFLQD